MVSGKCVYRAGYDDKIDRRGDKTADLNILGVENADELRKQVSVVWERI